MESINGDLAASVAVDTSAMDWTPSPSRTVWRKRVHLVGPPESGQVTSVVRYEPGSTFPIHDHPDGEEILVLDGVFSDEHGDWPAGTYLLNPEGFRHAPFSRDGCQLFVKLRQFPSGARNHIVINTDEMEWQPVPHTGIETKPLYSQPGFTDSMQLERWPANTTLDNVVYNEGAEIFIIEGEFQDDAGQHAAGAWLRFPAGSQHTPQTQRGCTIYKKTNGLRYLKSG